MVDHVYRELRQRIIDNAMPPGTQMLESELALLLGVSRTPVRGALLRLADEGLIEQIPRRGMRVLPLSAVDVREIYELIGYLEAGAADTLARRKPGRQALAPLDAAVRQMQNALARGDREGWAAGDRNFHHYLLSLAGNRRLAAIALGLLDQMQRVRMMTLEGHTQPETSTRNHAAVLEAIRRGDAQAARDLHLAHKRWWGGELEQMTVLARP